MHCPFEIYGHQVPLRALGRLLSASLAWHHHQQQQQGSPVTMRTAA
eukprot:COSAG06_NODE_19298_length_844_cov_1.484564_2_plen_45_part_01